MSKTIPEKKEDQTPPLCGVVMPISSMPDYPASHWEDVREILNSSISDAGFAPKMVSDADEVGVIHKRIIQRLQTDPIVVCDVSGKNPNVMFELGVRLTFNRPVVIVQDDKTQYNFDTAPIEHVSYPKDLHFHKISKFKELLSSKIKHTHLASINDTNYTSFLGHFSISKIPKLEQVEKSQFEYLGDELKDIKNYLRSMIQNEARPSTERMPPDCEVITQYHLDFELSKNIDAKFSPHFLRMRIGNRAVEIVDWHDNSTEEKYVLHISFKCSPSDFKVLLFTLRKAYPDAVLRGTKTF